MLQPNPQPELELVKAVLAGEPGAAERFIETTSVTLWSVTVQLEGDGRDGEAAFLAVIEALKDGGYARLKAFDGRSRLSVYLAITARDILADRLARGFVEAPARSWMRFERFFGADIRRRIAQRFPRDTGTGRRDDIYQEICLRFIEDDYRRIRGYDGIGSFAGYVLTVTERLLIDLIRRDAPRRRLPAAVARLSQLDQEIYAAVVWGSQPPDTARLVQAMRGRFEKDPDEAEIRQAMERLTALAPLVPAPPSPRAETVSFPTSEDGEQVLDIADSRATPEQQLLEDEEAKSRAKLLAAVKAASRELAPEERLYLQTIFSASDPLPARDIARSMKLPVEEVYRLKQRMQRWLKEIAKKLEET
jgi:RNA polymerase primary sigma factor